MSSRIIDAILGRERSGENPQHPLTSAKLLDWLGVDWATETGVTVTPETAMRFTAVYRAVALLGGLIGELPLKAYRDEPDGGRRRVRAPVIEQPHVDKTPMEVWEYAGASLMTWGNSYNLKLKDGLGRIQELEPLDPAKMTVETRGEFKTDANPSGKRFTYRDGSDTRTYTPAEVLHIPGLSYDGVVGLSPIQLSRQGIGLGMAAEKFGAKMFGRGALIQGVLETEKRLDSEDAARLKSQWRDKTSGPDRQWDIPVLDQDAHFKPIALPPADAQYIETRKFSITDIARLYGLPPHLLADVERSTSWGTGIEQQNMQMLTFTLDPWLVRIEQRATKELLPSGVYAKFTRQALLRADTSARFLAYQRAINNGWMNADEIREREELPPIPDGGGQGFYRPGNLEPVTDGDGDGDGDEQDSRRVVAMQDFVDRRSPTETVYALG